MVLQANNSKKKMEKKSSNDIEAAENINIIRKIIDDFETEGKIEKKVKKKIRNKLMSSSDSTLSNNECRHAKRFQVSPKPSHSLRGSLMYRLNSSTAHYYDPLSSEHLSMEKSAANNVYINFMENCENENTEGNRFAQSGKTGRFTDKYLEEYTSHSGDLEKNCMQKKFSTNGENFAKIYSEERKMPRKSIWGVKGGSQDPAAALLDEINKYGEDKKHQERVNQNVKEVCL
ncbi:hypothetical protein HUJ04_000794 [Dendroctonus ponderosae]|nr:hypothetical protein HUJ04_000794 [Dendroctonus ponderosae]